MKTAALAGILLLAASSGAFAGDCSDPSLMQTLNEVRRCQWLDDQAEMIATERDALVAQRARNGSQSSVPQAQVSIHGPKEITMMSNVADVPLK